MQVNQVNLSKFSPKAKQTIEEILNRTTPTLYSSPGASTLLLAQTPSALVKTYPLQQPVRLYATELSAGTSDLVSRKIKLATETAGILSDFGGKVLVYDYPSTAVGLQGLSVFVGAYGCIDKLLKPEKYSHWRRVFCLADFVVTVLNFLGNFIPQLKNASTALLGIKVVIKIGDKVEEYKFSLREKQGRELFSSIQSGGPFRL
jgi:hypothetical protein